MLLTLGGGAPAAAQPGEPEAPPFIATPEQVVETMLQMADVGEGDLVYDLGSGDGRLVIAAAARGARAIGVEYDPGLVARSRESAERAGLRDRASFVHGDIFVTDVSDADVVMLYLSPEFNLRLRPTLLRLRPGAQVVSHAFHMGEWQPDGTRTIGRGAARATVYHWIVPASVDGFWWLEIEGMSGMTFELSQSFQELEGQAWIEGRPLRLSGRVNGATLALEIMSGEEGEGAALRFRGSVVDGVVAGVSDGTLLDGARQAMAVPLGHPSRAPVGDQ